MLSDRAYTFAVAAAAHDTFMTREPDLDERCALEEAIDGLVSDATNYEIADWCFTRLAEIAEAEKELAKEKARYRAWLEKEAQERGGELSAAGYKATWSPAAESITYPVKKVREWIVRNANMDFIPEFVETCQETSARSGSLRITKEKGK